MQTAVHVSALSLISETPLKCSCCLRPLRRFCKQIVCETVEADKDSRSWTAAAWAVAAVPCIALTVYTSVWYWEYYTKWDGFLLFFSSCLLMASFAAISKTFHSKFLIFQESFCKWSVCDFTHVHVCGDM